MKEEPDGLYGEISFTVGLCLPWQFFSLYFLLYRKPRLTQKINLTNEIDARIKECTKKKGEE